MSGKYITPTVCDRARRLSEVHPEAVVCQMTGISANSLHMLKKRGFKAYARPLRPVPNDWGIVAPERTSLWLREHYKTSPAAIARWHREKPVKRPSVRRAKPVPADLRETLARMSVTEACAHYGVVNDTMTKWRRGLGIPVRFEAPLPALGWAERYVAAQRSTPIHQGA